MLLNLIRSLPIRSPSGLPVHVAASLAEEAPSRHGQIIRQHVLPVVPVVAAPFVVVPKTSISNSRLSHGVNHLT